MNFKIGEKIIVKGDDCWQGPRHGEILKIEHDDVHGTQILVKVTEEFWALKEEIEEDV